MKAQEIKATSVHWPEAGNHQPKHRGSLFALALKITVMFYPQRQSTREAGSGPIGFRAPWLRPKMAPDVTRSAVFWLLISLFFGLYPHEAHTSSVLETSLPIYTLIAAFLMQYCAIAERGRCAETGANRIRYPVRQKWQRGLQVPLSGRWVIRSKEGPPPIRSDGMLPRQHKYLPWIFSSGGPPGLPLSYNNAN